MKLYDINQEIIDCIDMETGEIIAPEKLEALQMDKHEKLRNIAFVALNAAADAKAYEEQEKKFSARKKAAKATVEWAKATLARELGGEKMKEPEFTISYRKSEVVEIANLNAVPDEFLAPQPPKVDKVGLKKAVKGGAVIDGVTIVEKQNIQIK